MLLVKKNPQHTRYTDGSKVIGVPDYNPNSKYNFGVEIPHLLNIFSGVKAVDELKHGSEVCMIVSPDDALKEGDEISTEYGDTVMVSKIIERRPARGDWSNNPFCKQPDFIHISYL